MDKELKELKSVLRSIVVSSPAQVDVRSLQRDYRNMMGGPIPLAKYGYRDVLAFLKERCGDCFLFQGMPSNPVLTLIVPESLKHIDQFVQKQKPSAVTKMKGKRRSVREYSKSPENTNMICKTFSRNNTSAQQLNDKPEVKPTDVQNENLNRSSTKLTDNMYSSTKLTDNMYSSTKLTDNMYSSTKLTDNMYSSTKKLTENHTSTPNIKSDRENVNLGSQIKENGLHGSVRYFLKKRLPMYDSSQYLDSEECSEPEKVSSKGDNDSGRQTSSSQSSTRKAQLEELKNEIYELIKEHEDGILCTDLLRLYRERYSRELNLTRFGHNNINSVLRALAGRVTFAAGPAGARVHAGPAPAPRGPGALARGPPGLLSRPHSLRALPVDPDDALPGIDFEPDVFPPDCMHFMESVPPLTLSDVCAGAMLPVAVGEVYSPSHFWLQRLGENYHAAMDRLMDEMTEYYNTGPGKDRVLSRGAVRVGHYCSSVYDRDWHRSLIVKVIDADTVKVRHVDYGTVDSVQVSALKPLLRRWAALPAQALRARLAGLRPGAGGRRWPHAAAAHFLHLVRDKNFVANVVAIDPEEETIETFLIDTQGADDVCVTREMIRAGHADARPDSALRTGECYLYPRFEALESGATPNFAEIHRYLADGINLEFVDAYRRHVPAALPEPRPPAPAPPPPLPAPAAPPAARLPRPHGLLTRVPLLRAESPPASPPAAPSPAPAPPEPARAPSPPAPAPPPAAPPAPPRPPAPAPPPHGLLTGVPLLRAEAPPAPPPAPPEPARAPSPPAPPRSAAPRTPHAYPQPPPCPWRAPPPPPYACYPAPFVAPAPWGEVRLSLQECEMYSLLSSLDPEAAHCYMLSALRRAAVAAGAAGAAGGGARPLNPHAPEFRAAYPQPPAPPPPLYMRAPHPPPWF